MTTSRSWPECWWTAGMALGPGQGCEVPSLNRWFCFEDLWSSASNQRKHYTTPEVSIGELGGLFHLPLHHTVRTELKWLKFMQTSEGKCRKFDKFVCLIACKNAVSTLHSWWFSLYPKSRISTQEVCIYNPLHTSKFHDALQHFPEPWVWYGLIVVVIHS